MNKIKEKRLVFEGKVVKVYEVDLQFPHSEPTFELIGFDVVTGVSALPIDANGDVILIRHYQAGLDEMGWSLPTGGLHKGEKPEERMQLELREEIGMKAGKLTLMTRYQLLPSYVGGEPGYLYLAENLTPSRREGDEDYEIEIVPTHFAEALAMVKRGDIGDARASLAILYYQQFL